MSDEKNPSRCSSGLATCPAPIVTERMAAIERNLEKQAKLIEEIIGLLRGRDLDSGLVGRLRELEERTEQVQSVFKWFGVVLAGVLIAVLGQYFQ